MQLPKVRFVARQLLVIACVENKHSKGILFRGQMRYAVPDFLCVDYHGVSNLLVTMQLCRTTLESISKQEVIQY